MRDLGGEAPVDMPAPRTPRSACVESCRSASTALRSRLLGRDAAGRRGSRPLRRPSAGSTRGPAGRRAPTATDAAGFAPRGQIGLYG